MQNMDSTKLEEFREVMDCFASENTFSVQDAIDKLFPFVDFLIEHYESFYLPDEEDWRSGEETYGYGAEDILGWLCFICGKWGCAFRVRWMIDLITPDYYPYKSEAEKNYKPTKRGF